MIIFLTILMACFSNGMDTEIEMYSSASSSDIDVNPPPENSSVIDPEGWSLYVLECKKIVGHMDPPYLVLTTENLDTQKFKANEPIELRFAPNNINDSSPIFPGKVKSNGFRNEIRVILENFDVLKDKLQEGIQYLIRRLQNPAAESSKQRNGRPRAAAAEPSTSRRREKRPIQSTATYNDFSWMSNSSPDNSPPDDLIEIDHRRSFVSKNDPRSDQYAQLEEPAHYSAPSSPSADDDDEYMEMMSPPRKAVADPGSSSRAMNNGKQRERRRNGFWQNTFGLCLNGNGSEGDDESEAPSPPVIARRQKTKNGHRSSSTRREKKASRSSSSIAARHEKKAAAAARSPSASSVGSGKKKSRREMAEEMTMDFLKAEGMQWAIPDAVIEGQERELEAFERVKEHADRLLDLARQYHDIGKGRKEMYAEIEALHNALVAGHGLARDNDRNILPEQSIGSVGSSRRGESLSRSTSARQQQQSPEEEPVQRSRSERELTRRKKGERVEHYSPVH